MQALLDNLSKFINVSLQLYAPLPFEFTSDLYTLNAYLKTYSEKQQKLLEGFVDRLEEKLTTKVQNNILRFEINNESKNSQHEVFRHYNSETIKYPQLKLELPADNFEKSYNREIKTYSYSSRSSDEEGIKPNHHKFGTKDKAKQLQLNEGVFNKQNISLYANTRNTTRQNWLQEAEDRSLQFIKSEAELMPSYSLGFRKINVETTSYQKSIVSKPKYELNDEKLYPSSQSQSKIKIKPKSTRQFHKLVENINQIDRLMEQNEKQINCLRDEINFWETNQMQFYPSNL